MLQMIRKDVSFNYVRKYNGREKKLKITNLLPSVKNITL